MADRPVPALGPGVTTDPIARIAQADRDRTAATQSVQGAQVAFDTEVDLQPAYRPFAPQGLAGQLDAALGGVRLPTLLGLADALDKGRSQVADGAAIDPALTSVINAVLDDETRKLMRYMDLRDK